MAGSHGLKTKVLNFCQEYIDKYYSKTIRNIFKISKAWCLNWVYVVTETDFSDKGTIINFPFVKMADTCRLIKKITLGGFIYRAAYHKPIVSVQFFKFWCIKGEFWCIISIWCGVHLHFSIKDINYALNKREITGKKVYNSSTSFF